MPHRFGKRQTSYATRLKKEIAQGEAAIQQMANTEMTNTDNPLVDPTMNRNIVANFSEMSISQIERELTALTGQEPSAKRKRHNHRKHRR